MEVIETGDAMSGNDEIRLLHEKLDRLDMRMASLVSWIRPLEELKEDVALFSSDAFNEVIKFLADIDFHFRSQDFLFFIKKLLVNIKNLSKMMDLLQSATEFMDDVEPLAKDIFNEIIEKMSKLEEHRFFDSINMMMEFPIKWNQNFTPEEIQNFSESIIKVAKLFTKISTPENLGKADEILNIIGELQKSNGRKVSFFKTMKKLFSTDVLKKIDLVLDIIKRI
jgi:hypothetical protein